MAKNKKVIYTIILGAYDNLKEPDLVCPDFDYICFTDRKDLVSKTWTIHLIKCKPKINLKRCASRFITYPFKYLKEYEISMLIGGQISIHCDIGNFVDKVLPGGKSLAIMIHPKRDCIYQEAEVVLECKKDKPEIVTKQMEKYRNNKYPEHAGLVSSGIIVRRHSDKKMVKHCKLWYREVLNFSQRDQLSFNYILWKYRLIEPSYFYPEVRKSDFIVRPHNFIQQF